jgi:hypothetical protein
VSPEPPPVSEARSKFVDFAVPFSWALLCFLLWWLSMEPWEIALSWVGDKLGCSIRTVLWLAAGAASAVGSVVWYLWPKLEAVCGMGCL